jgi:hypothetical protein
LIDLSPQTMQRDSRRFVRSSVILHHEAWLGNQVDSNDLQTTAIWFRGNQGSGPILFGTRFEVAVDRAGSIVVRLPVSDEKAQGLDLGRLLVAIRAAANGQPHSARSDPRQTWLSVF